MQQVNGPGIGIWRGIGVRKQFHAAVISNRHRSHDDDYICHKPYSPCISECVCVFVCVWVSICVRMCACVCAYAKAPATCRNLRLLIEMFSNNLIVTLFFFCFCSSLSSHFVYFHLRDFAILFAFFLFCLLDCRFTFPFWWIDLINYLGDCAR